MSVLRKLLAAIEPWYDWGTIEIDRMEGRALKESGYYEPTSYGGVRYFQLQWFGLHLGIQIGRTPKRDVPAQAKVASTNEPKLPEDSDPAHVFEDHARWAVTVEQPA